MHKILQNFHASVCGLFRRFGSRHFLIENFMTSVIKLGLKMVKVPNVNCPIKSRSATLFTIVAKAFLFTRTREVHIAVFVLMSGPSK
jgi:hypothetical protein